MPEYREISKEELQHFLEQHKLWLESDEKSGECADLRGANLHGVDLHGAILKGADLQEAGLQGAYLQDVNLQEANLFGADLQEANLQSANLQRANLQRANLREAGLQGARLWGTHLYEANLTGANMVSASLMATVFINSVLNHALLVGAQGLATPQFQGATLEGASIDAHSFSKLPPDIQEAWADKVHFVDLSIKSQADKIIREIEFPPEYHQAGLSILNYFGTVLRKKYPEDQVSVQIRQDGLKVTMTVETQDGQKEKYEELLEEYGLVITGKMLPEKFSDNPPGGHGPKKSTQHGHDSN
ncbi:pentapeptide repeat protein [Desulfatibacillum aliphaticivorans]|uniref:Pentapeptide repeat protein n=1 Tax=Desulfatibacillum aliphaticivorans TaxID=218208 RepID=B8FDI6_DESAL|nr:pentapeptide repeat-containing protein [Desulfatibacillum aliphaticivorans]ACL06617.1 pentapeptide repeat protein [Desulfatibacillum aliphaticivorans]